MPLRSAGFLYTVPPLCYIETRETGKEYCL